MSRYVKDKSVKPDPSVPGWANPAPPKKKISKLLKRKIRAQYTYLRLEVDYHESEFEKAKKAFDEHFNKMIDKEKEAKSFAGIIDSSEDKNIPIDIDKAYKKIAQKVHPDKAGGSDKAFKELRQAVNNCDIDEILRIAAEHDIDIEADENIDMHKFYLDGINKLEQELQMKRATVAFQWWNGDDETKKRIEESIVGLYGQKDENV